MWSMMASFNFISVITSVASYSASQCEKMYLNDIIHTNYLLRLFYMRSCWYILVGSEMSPIHFGHLQQWSIHVANASRNSMCTGFTS